MNTGLPNKEYRVVFKPKEGTLYYDKKRKYFAIGSRSIAKYIGNGNAKHVVKKAEAMTKDSVICRFRETGVIYVYLK